MVVVLLPTMDALIILCFTTDYCMIEPWNWAQLVPWKKKPRKILLSFAILGPASSSGTQFFGIQILNKSWPVVVFSAGFRSKPVDFTAPALIIYIKSTGQTIWGLMERVFSWWFHYMPSKLSGGSSFPFFNLPLRPSLEQKITRKAKRAPIRHTSPENRNAAQSWSFFCGKCRLSEMSNAPVYGSGYGTGCSRIRFFCAILTRVSEVLLFVCVCIYKTERYIITFNIFLIYIPHFWY